MTIIQRVQRALMKRYRCLVCGTGLTVFLHGGKCPVCGHSLVPIERKRLEDWNE